jgi:hypothetical protein
MPIQSSCSEGLRYGRTSRSRFDSFFERIYETGSKKFPRQCSPEVFLRPGSSSPQHVSFFDPLPGLVLRMICALGNPIFLIQHMMPNKYLLANMLVRYYGCGFYLHKHSYSLFCRCVSTYCLFFSHFLFASISYFCSCTSNIGAKKDNLATLSLILNKQQSSQLYHKVNFLT